MVVLDEQLLGRGIEGTIAKWYGGSVVFITDLRPGTVIKDDAIPQILGDLRKPAFITINAGDFWRKTPADKRYCIICFPIRDVEVPNIPPLLKSLFRHEDFKTKEKRSGHVFRITLSGRIRFYSINHQQERELTL
jgi:hypothetical protein